MKEFFSKISNIFKKSKKKKINGDSKKQRIIKIASFITGGLLLIAALIYFVVRDPSFLVVAKVNNSYITRSELNTLLVKNFGDQVLEELIYKKMAEAEFKKNGVNVSDSDVEEKVAEIEQNLGGMSLEEALASSGMTMEDLNESIIFQLSIEKLLGDRVAVTEEEISDFILTYEIQLEGMSDEEKSNYAREQLEGQNLQIEMADWLEEIKQNSNIKLFLK